MAIATWIKDIKGQLIKLECVTRIDIGELYIDERSGKAIDKWPVNAVTSGIGGRDDLHTLTEAKTEKAAQEYVISLGLNTGGIAGQ